MNTTCQDLTEQEPQIDFWGILKCGSLEALFRARHRDREIHQVSVALLLVIALTLLFVPVDRYIFGPGPAFQGLLAGRVIVATLAAMLLGICRRPNHSAASRDRVLLLFGVCGAAFMVSLGAILPTVHLAGYVLTAICLLSIIHFLAPLPVPHKAALGALYTGADTHLVLSRHLEFSVVLLAATAAAYVVTNLIGLLVSRNVNHARREQFTTQLRLESALAAVRTLDGILPICAHCKKIRTSDGFWEPVEVYVRDRTHAEFSHSICPSCVQNHYASFLPDE